MEINKILFNKLAQSKEIEYSFEDFDINNDEIINNTDINLANSQISAEITSLINSADSEPEIICNNEADTDIFVSQLSDIELESKISELQSNYDFDDLGRLNAKNWDETLANKPIENLYKELLSEKIKRNSEKYTTSSEKETADRWNNGGWSGKLMSLNIGELEYLIAQNAHLNGRGVSLNYAAIAKEPDWENRLRIALESANVLLWADYNIEETINNVKKYENDSQEFTQDRLKSAYNNFLSATGLAWGAENPNLFPEKYLLDVQAYDLNNDGQIDFCDLNSLPEEIDFDGDGCISEQEKSYLSGLKYCLYDYIDRMTKESLIGTQNYAPSQALNVDIDQIIERSEFLSKNPDIQACSEDFDNLYTTVFDTFDLAVEVGKLQKKHNTTVRMSPTLLSSPVNTRAYDDFVSKNGRVPSTEELNNHIKKYYYEYNNIVRIFERYIDNESLSKTELEDILAKLNIVSDLSVKQELLEIKDIIEKRIKNF